MFGPAANQRAHVDDVTGTSEYRVVAVDGRSENRSDSSIHTVVPLVELEPGTHSLTLRHPDSDDEILTLTGNFEAGTTYVIKSQDGEPRIQEDARH